MSYKALVAPVSVRPHPNSSNGLKILLISGFQVITAADVKDGELMIFFPEGGVLAEEFLSTNNEYRPKLGLNKNQQALRQQLEDHRAGKITVCCDHDLIDQINAQPGGFFEEHGRVRTIRLRGERSEGYAVRPEMLAYTGFDVSTFYPGQTFDELNGHQICWKYISPATRRAMRALEKVKGVRKYGLDMFHEHYDTENLRYELQAIPDGARAIVTEKLHGTSGRTGRVLADVPTMRPRHHQWIERWNARVPSWLRISLPELPQMQEWKVVTGTRKVVRYLGEEDLRPDLGGEDHATRWAIHQRLAPVLKKGETIYYEIVGYWSGTDVPIFRHPIPEDEVGNLIFKAFKKLIPAVWGRGFNYVYGCLPGSYEVYVYRITQTNEDGQSIDLSWEQIQTRCKVLGLRVVPEIAEWRYKTSRPHQEDEITALIPNRYDITYQGPSHWDEMSYEADVYGPSVLCKVLDQLGARASSLDPRHISEGVCVRFEHPDYMRTLKHKSWNFRVLEGLAYSDDGYIDVEDAS